MKLIHKLVYALFAAIGIILILFAVGVIDGEDLGIQPINQEENQEDDNQEDDNQDLQDDADEAMDDATAETGATAPEVTSETTITEEGDLSNPMFTSYNFDNYENASYTMEMNVNQNIGGGDQAQQQNTSQMISGTFIVDAEATDGVLAGTYGYEDFNIAVEGNEMIQQQLEQAMASFKDVFLEAQYVFEVDTNGDIMNISIDYDGENVQGTQFVEQFSETVRESFFMLPEGEIGEGGTWEVTKRVESNGSSVVNTIAYTVSEVADGQATIDVAVTQSMDDEQIGSGEGQVIITQGNPFPVESSLTVTSNFAVPVPQQEITMEQVISTNISRIE